MPAGTHHSASTSHANQRQPSDAFHNAHVKATAPISFINTWLHAVNRHGYTPPMFAIGAAIVWFLTAPFIGVFDDPANGLYVGLALFALHDAIAIALPTRG